MGVILPVLNRESVLIEKKAWLFLWLCLECLALLLSVEP